MSNILPRDLFNSANVSRHEMQLASESEFVYMPAILIGCHDQVTYRCWVSNKLVPCIKEKDFNSRSLHSLLIESKLCSQNGTKRIVLPEYHIYFSFLNNLILSHAVTFILSRKEYLVFNTNELRKIKKVLFISFFLALGDISLVNKRTSSLWVYFKQNRIWQILSLIFGTHLKTSIDNEYQNYIYLLNQNLSSYCQNIKIYSAQPSTFSSSKLYLNSSLSSLVAERKHLPVCPPGGAKTTIPFSRNDVSQLPQLQKRTFWASSRAFCYCFYGRKYR